jgi:hypothetical protein
MAMDLAEKLKKVIFCGTKAQGRLLLFWVGCVCHMCMLYAFAGTILYNPKPPIWLLIAFPDLAGDRSYAAAHMCVCHLSKAT